MPARTCYVALPFDRRRGGGLIPMERRDCVDADAASRQARHFGRSHAGAIAFATIIDIEAGTAQGARLLTTVGEVPNLTYLLGA